MVDTTKTAAPAVTGGDGPPPSPTPTAAFEQPRRSRPLGLLVKYALLGLVLAVSLFFSPRLIEAQAWSFFVMMWGATIAIFVVYLTKRALPAKYLLPGTIFLLAFQIYPVAYNTYVAFTNFGTANRLTQDQATTVIQQRALRTPEGAPRFAAVPMTDGDAIGLLLTNADGEVFLGTADGLEPLPDVSAEALPDEVDGFRRLSLGAATQRQDELLELRVPLEPTPEGDERAVQLISLSQASVRESVLSFDEDAGTLTNEETGVQYAPDQERGFYLSDTGERLTPGWRVPVGWANYSQVFTSREIRGPFARVFIWTYVFALLSVLFTFAVGLLLAMTLSSPKLRGQRLYRTVMIIPYALPSFLTALIWAGLLNQNFGAVNRLLDASIPWLTDPLWAKASILLVNTWLGFPYMFLICAGALTAIPAELIEAAKTDGATGFGAFRRITFPLLLVTTGPLLIASFAFNFNNFNIIYLITQGGPPIAGAATPAGHTDILISYTYRLAFAAGSGGQYGFAAAISVLIFIMVAAITAFSFRYTKVLEDLN